MPLGAPDGGTGEAVALGRWPSTPSYRGGTLATFSQPVPELRYSVNAYILAQAREGLKIVADRDLQESLGYPAWRRRPVDEVADVVIEQLSALTLEQGIDDFTFGSSRGRDDQLRRFPKRSPR